MEERNPFEHHHHHHHDEPPLRMEELDPAQQSLADALRISFILLIAVMCILVVFFLFSGVFSVAEQEVAVKLRFGKVVGQDRQAQIIQPGGPYFALPFPVDEIVRIRTAPRQLQVDKAFRYHLPPGSEGRSLDEIQGGPLDPERDGSVITGDANIMHLQASVTYRVADPVAYMQNVGHPELSQQLVQAVSEQGLVLAAARADVEDLYAGRFDREYVLAHMNGELEKIDSGLRVTGLSLDKPEMPLAVREAFRAVVNAEQEMAQKIEQARQERARILGETAGSAHEPVLALIEQYEVASQIENEQALNEAEAALEAAFGDLELTDPRLEQPVAIGGRVAEVISQAQTYRTQVVEAVRANADRFQSLLPEYQRNPRIVTTRLWQDALETIMTGDVETIYLPAGQQYIEINRDPDVQRRREEQRLQQEQARRMTGG